MASDEKPHDDLLKRFQKHGAAWRYLSNNYANASKTLDRYINLIQRFHSEFSCKPHTILRAPGRVNLLGGHTDYNGCPVIPIAIDRDILAAISARNDSQIVLTNTEPRFERRSFQIAHQIEPYLTGDWGNYIKAAVQGMVTHFEGQNRDQRLNNGFNMAVSGNIPHAAGMSSSSALVVLSALAFLYTNSVHIDKLELAQLLAKAEWYVGTQGGGMDQTISLLGQADHALKIEFNPYSIMPVVLPRDYQYIVTHSLVYAPKTESALNKYNQRPIECRLAVALIKNHVQKKFNREFDIRLIGDLTRQKLGLSDEQIYQLCLEALPEKSYSYSSLSVILRKTINEIQQSYCLKRDGTVFDEPEDGFKLRSRFIHIFTEWKRVLMAVELLKGGDVLELGHLMNEAQISCRENYEISVPEIDKLVELSLTHGAIGARLTGAGFGGCVVNLVPEKKVPYFIERIGKKYYQKFARKLLPPDRAWQDFIFVCKSVDGAGEAIFWKYLNV